jgi:hypothetical protein
VAIWLHFPESTGEPHDAQVRLTLQNGSVVLVQGLVGAGSIAVCRPEEDPSHGWYSPRYGVRRAGTAVAVGAARAISQSMLCDSTEVGDPGLRSRVASGCSPPHVGEILGFLRSRSVQGEAAGEAGSLLLTENQGNGHRFPGRGPGVL